MVVPIQNPDCACTSYDVEFIFDLLNKDTQQAKICYTDYVKLLKMH